MEIFGRLADREDADYRVRADALRMMGRALGDLGAHDSARDCTERAVILAEALDPGVAAEALLDHAFASWVLGGPIDALPVAERARGIALAAQGPSRARAQATWAFAALQVGDAGPLAAVDGIPAVDPTGIDLTSLCSPWGLLGLRAGSAMQVERLAEAEDIYQGGLAQARRLGAVQGLATLATGLAEVLLRRGRVADAAAAIAELDTADLPAAAVVEVGAVQAGILLMLGRVDESLAWCERVEGLARERGEWFPLLRVWTARVEIHLSRGDTDEAAELARRIEQVAGSMGLGEPCAVPWARVAIAAHLAVGSVAEARGVVAWLDDRATRLPCLWPRIVAELGRASLAERGAAAAAQAHVATALQLHTGLDMPLEHARSLLAAGHLERRHGRPSLGRPLFAQAVRIAEDCGAVWLAEQAVADLRVAGGRRRRSRYGANELTGQEQRVAELAGAGRRNEEIANRLHISVSTVKTHLSRVYAKLELSSRRHLISMARDTEEWTELVSGGG